jgi:phosphoribosylaminoimidazole-succinocarboxamide synthase
VNQDLLLIVTTDRLSAFDVVMPEPVPGKGRVLTAMSLFWFDLIGDLLPNQLTGIALSDVIQDSAIASQLAGRALVVKRLNPLPIEAVVRGYLIGSGWKDYQASGEVCGIPLPEHLKQAQQLPEVLYTPASKAESGDHDENISFAQTELLLGPELAARVRDVSLAIYTLAANYARERGIIIADTKFEFGLDADGTLHLIDEVLTPDSSRFWPADSYVVGTSPPSFDKQFVRDYLETLDWDKRPPAPSIPADILKKSADNYREALTRLTGTSDPL